MKRYIPIGLVLALALGACASVNKWLGNNQAAIQTGITVACDYTAAANQGFQVVAGTGKLSAKDITEEKAIYAGVVALCANPPVPTDTAGIAAAVAKIMGDAALVYGLLNDAHVNAAVAESARTQVIAPVAPPTTTATK